MSGEQRAVQAARENTAVSQYFPPQTLTAAPFAFAASTLTNFYFARQQDRRYAGYKLGGALLIHNMLTPSPQHFTKSCQQRFSTHLYSWEERGQVV